MRDRRFRNCLSVTVAFAVGVVLAAPVPAAAGTIKQIRIAEKDYGHIEWNTIPAPIYDAAGVTPLAVEKVTGSFDAKANIVRGRGNLFTKGPTEKLDPKVVIGDVLAESMRAEAKAMGLPLAAEGAAGGAFRVSGDIKDIYIESWQMTGYGNILYYGFIDLALTVQGPQGAAESRRYRVHGFTEEGGGGFSRTGKSEAALARLIVNGSQEVLARLNREFLKAKPTAAVNAKVAALKAPGLEAQAAALRMIGLAGAVGAETALPALLPAEKDSDGRVHVIEALGNLGAAGPVAGLTERYAKEDEQGRWYTLKALDSIGGDAAAAFIADKGPKDQEYSVKSLAGRITGQPVKD